MQLYKHNFYKKNKTKETLLVLYSFSHRIEFCIFATAYNVVRH